MSYMFPLAYYLHTLYAIHTLSRCYHHVAIPLNRHITFSLPWFINTRLHTCKQWWIYTLVIHTVLLPYHAILTLRLLSVPFCCFSFSFSTSLILNTYEDTTLLMWHIHITLLFTYVYKILRNAWKMLSKRQIQLRCLSWKITCNFVCTIENL